MVLTAERVYGQEPSDNYLYQRQSLAYIKAAGLIKGNVLELGTGDGYGLSEISGAVDHLITIDKYKTSSQVANYPNVEYRQEHFPPFSNIADNSMDCVISFLVIEHIKDDDLFVREIKRVLKKGGRVIITTPNKKMTLVRNPWHIREYTREELVGLMSRHLDEVTCEGIAGNKKVMDYYWKNAASVRKILRFDIFGLHKRLPGFLLRMPYDIMNRLNRKKLLKNNTQLTTGITQADYFFDNGSDLCFDLFAIATKH